MNAASFTPVVSRTRSAALIMTTGFIAIWAVAGAVGLAGGGIELGSVIDERLPGHSPVFAAIALLVIVALPMAATAVFAARHDARAPGLALIAGVALIGWIIVQMSLIRTFSWLQPLCVVLGLVVIWLGLPFGHRRARAGDRTRAL